MVLNLSSSADVSQGKLRIQQKKIEFGYWNRPNPEFVYLYILCGFGKKRARKYQFGKVDLSGK